MMNKKHNTRSIKKNKISKNCNPLSMLTCYDYQSAQLLNETDLDLILVGDSVGNVILGYETTVEVTLQDMITFGSAVKRGAKDKFVVVDLPFGTYSIADDAIRNSVKLFQKTKCEALKLEGASANHLEIIRSLTATGIPIMGHIGLTPQSVHELGGYYQHGKTEQEGARLLKQAKDLQDAGCFAIVLECITPLISAMITKEIKIPTIGIGSGKEVDGQVLVLNDLLKMGKENPPSFCSPVSDLFELKKSHISNYLFQIKNLKPNSNADHVQ